MKSVFEKHENWTEHPTFWQYKTLYPSWSKAFIAAQKINNICHCGASVLQIETFEDHKSTGFVYAVWTQFNPF